MTWSCFTDVVNVIYQIATTIIAGFGAWVAYQTLIRTPVQESEPESAEISELDVNAPSEVRVFKTSKQSTWLKVTEKGLECHLKDNRTGKGGHQWTLSREQSKKILSVRDYRIYPGYKLYSGVFSIGPRKNWLYSKKLFPEPSLLELELERLLRNAST
ncbi:MAG: hypothetical protein AB2588_08380 [Candidatus Thiodiazotropha sp.]